MKPTGTDPDRSGPADTLQRKQERIHPRWARLRSGLCFSPPFMRDEHRWHGSKRGRHRPRSCLSLERVPRDVPSTILHREEFVGDSPDRPEKNDIHRREQWGTPAPDPINQAGEACDVRRGNHRPRPQDESCHFIHYLLKIDRNNLQIAHRSCPQSTIRRRRLADPHADEGNRARAGTARCAGKNLARSQKMGASIIGWNAAV